MDVLFENQFVRNKELAKEFNAYILFRRPAMIPLYIIMSVLVISLIINAVLQRADAYFYLAAVVAYTILKIVQYFRSVSIMVKRDIEMSGGDLSVNCLVTEDVVQYSHAGSAATPVQLTNIKRWITTKHYIMLCSGTKLIYFLRKDGFTKGTEGDFYKFLERKGIQRGR